MIPAAKEFFAPSHHHENEENDQDFFDNNTQWIDLPGEPSGAIMTYMSGGKQYLAVPVGGRRSPGTAARRVDVNS